MLFSKSKISSLTDKEEDRLEKNLVWIFAYMRSGTTWLGTELLRHNSHIINESNLCVHLGSTLPSNNNFKTDYEMYHDRDKKHNYFFSYEYEDTWMYYLRKLILNRIVAQVKDISKKVIIKEPGGAGYLRISECLPKSKIIWIIRDGRDVLDSILDASNLEGWASRQSGRITGLGDQQKLNLIKARGKDWVKKIDVLFDLQKKHENSLFYTVRYENLRRKTFEELKKIYNFVDIEISDEKLAEIVERYEFDNIPESKKGSGKPKRSATPGKWKENLSDKEIKEMSKIINNTLKKLDYEV